MAKRAEYYLQLNSRSGSGPGPLRSDLVLRAAGVEDALALAELMIEAYRGTIDYDGETLADALEEVQAYLDGERGGRPMLGESCLAFEGSLLVGACLTAEWDDRGLPIIAYVMTRGDRKNRGVGKQVLWRVLEALEEGGQLEVRAVITKGNRASERLLGRAGFQAFTG